MSQSTAADTSSLSALKQYRKLVRLLANKMKLKVPPSVQMDDLIQVGMIGLNDALSRFDASQGVAFEAYATRRICGAMLDELRRTDHLSRGDRQQQRAIEAAVQKAEQKLGRAALEREIAKEMGISLAEYQELLGKVFGGRLMYLEDLAGDAGGNGFLDRYVGDPQSDPLTRLQDQRRRAALVEAIKMLPEREQYMMSAYYEHDTNLREVAAVLKITESRACQLHNQVILRLRAKLHEH